MNRLLQEFGPKIIGLARSIAEHGLNPTESWAIVREEGKYVVLEGNRRLVACRLLANPNRALDPEIIATFERIKRGARSGDSYLTPNCVEFEHRSDARYWIHLKHHGAGSGEGTSAWGPEMVYLDRVNSGNPPVEWNEFWYWLEETYQHDLPLIDLIDRARREQYTLMERVYTWKVKELLGARFIQPGRIDVNVNPDRIKPFISALVTGMLTPQPKDVADPGAANVLVISSRTLNSRDSAERKIENVWRDIIGNVDVTSAATDQDDATAVSNPTQNDKNTAPVSDDLDSGIAAAPTHPKSSNDSRIRQPKPRKSETHLYYGVKFSHMPRRLDALLRECRNLEISKSPETASVMARIAVELAADALLDHHGLTPKDHQLVSKLIAVLRHLDPKLESKRPNCPELSGAWAAIRTDSTDGHFIRDLNSCVHSYQFTATFEIAKRANVLFTPLLNAIAADIDSPSASTTSTSTGNRQA